MALLQPSGQAQFQKPKGVRAGMRCSAFSKKDGPGVFVEFYWHCVTWDARQQLVIVTDPRYGLSCDINAEGEVPALGINACTRWVEKSTASSHLQSKAAESASEPQ